MTFKKTILVGLDGVLNTYKGDFNEHNIPAINEGAYEFNKKLAETYKLPFIHNQIQKVLLHLCLKRLQYHII